MACSVCNVALCNILRRDNKACFELFHEIEEMNNPGETNHSPVRVKWAAHNQSQPPSRRRNINDDPNTRASSQGLSFCFLSLFHITK
jgi:hypothetical protein